jgi:PleD family two-component response regulator
MITARHSHSRAIEWRNNVEPRDESPILIVDDTPGIREALQKILTKEGFTVFDAEDGEQAPRAAAEPAPRAKDGGFEGEF